MHLISKVLRYGDDDEDEIAYFTVRWKTRASDRRTLCLKQKVPTFKLSITLSNLNRFSKFSHCYTEFKGGNFFETQCRLNYLEKSGDFDDDQRLAAVKWISSVRGPVQTPCLQRRRRFLPRTLFRETWPLPMRRRLPMLTWPGMKSPRTEVMTDGSKRADQTMRRPSFHQMLPITLLPVMGMRWHQYFHTFSIITGRDFFSRILALRSLPRSSPILCLRAPLWVHINDLLAPCGLRGCKNRAHSVSWPEVVKSIPNQGVDCFVS